MNAVPAKVAGVERIVMVVPTPDGVINPLVLAAARIAGVDEIYRVGGAQAIAALAYGTETIQPVAKIVGPGNAYVAAAKRLVFGTVGIDMIAGPSEVLVVADADNDPDWIAADLLAQAEHDAAAQAILITDSADLADRVGAAVERQLKTLPRGETAAASWRDHGAIIIVTSLAAAMDLANRIAPEHLELAVADPEALLLRVRNAGAVFLGRHTPEVIGDYVGGSEPRAADGALGALLVGPVGARFPQAHLAPEARARAARAPSAPPAITLAEAEGLDAHARSVAIRLNRLGCGERRGAGSARPPGRGRDRPGLDRARPRAFIDARAGDARSTTCSPTIVFAPVGRTGERLPAAPVDHRRKLVLDISRRRRRAGGRATSCR